MSRLNHGRPSFAGWIEVTPVNQQSADTISVSVTDHRVMTLATSVIALTFGLLLGHGALDSGRLAAAQDADTASALIRPMNLTAVDLRSTDQLEDVFREAQFNWPPDNGVPELAISRFPDGMSELDANSRKTLFFRGLLPLVLAENERIRQQRERLREIFAQGDTGPDAPAREFLERVTERYRVEGDLNDPEVRARLLRRVDEIPAPLALAQAANESGWGTSRFALEANNVFGVWTWSQEEGLVPEQRAEGQNHRIRVFPDLRASVRNYMLTLNIGSAYGEFRRMRERMRKDVGQLNAMRLAEGLVPYSERGEEYVGELQAMIQGNDLQNLGEPRLRSVKP